MRFYRERVKTFTEALFLLNKCFPSLSTKKRSRPDVFSNDRSGSTLSSDLPMLGQGISKVGPQSNVIDGGFEREVQRPEERTKKRPRTSLVDLKVGSLDTITQCLDNFLFLFSCFSKTLQFLIDILRSRITDLISNDICSS